MADGIDTLVFASVAPLPAEKYSFEIYRESLTDQDLNELVQKEVEVGAHLEKFGRGKEHFYLGLPGLVADYYELVGREFGIVCDFFIRSYVTNCLPLKYNVREWGDLLTRPGSHARWDENFKESKSAYDSDTSILKVTNGFEDRMVLLIRYWCNIFTHSILSTAKVATSIQY